jgi:hypothetical protein
MVRKGINSLKKRLSVPFANVHWNTVAPYFRIFADDPDGCVRTMTSSIAMLYQTIEGVFDSVPVSVEGLT